VFGLSLQLLSEIILILRRTEQDITINVFRASCKVPVSIVMLQRNLNFLDRFSKNAQIPNVMKIRPVEAMMFCADRQTDRLDEANSRFSQFCKCAQKLILPRGEPRLPSCLATNVPDKVFSVI
jgi:hypothetical protein